MVAEAGRCWSECGGSGSGSMKEPGFGYRFDVREWPLKAWVEE